MTTLSNKLKSLGVKVGASELPPPRPRSHSRVGSLIEQALSAQPFDTPLGRTYVVDTRYPAEYRQGRLSLQITAPLGSIAEWAREQRICSCTPQSFAFLDTETTGLSGGTGTYAFLVGVGRFEGDEFHLAQYFMSDPLEEPAQLHALEQFIAPCEALVTFNGKAFDVPLLNTRFTTHGWRTPLSAAAHVDLLHLARRLWRDRLPNRALSSLEVQILGASRTEEDVPGWDIPRLYFEFLRDGDPQPLKRVFYHNAMDVISMAALFNHMAGLLDDPFGGAIQHAVDMVALAKLYEDLGDTDRAARLYLHALEHADDWPQRLPLSSLIEAVLRLAQIHKRRDDLEAAISLWEQAAGRQHLDAHIELAKVYEHRLRDYTAAIEWTQSAIALVRSPLFTPFERHQRLPDLQHRLIRLQRKQAAGGASHEESATAEEE